MLNRIGFIFFLLSFISLSAGGIIEKDNSDYQKVMQGEILYRDAVENSVRGVEALFLLPMSRDKLWFIITDYRNFKDYFDYIEKVNIIQEDNKGAILEILVNTILRTFDYTVDRRYEIPYHKLTWRKISGDFQTNSGSWEIEDTPDQKGCIVKYRTFVQLEGFMGRALAELSRSETTRRIQNLVNRLRSLSENQG